MQRQSGMKLRGILVVAIALMAFMGTSTNAQDVATGSATATLVVALTVASSAALAFGTVYQGVAKTVPVDDAAAGIFNITGLESAILAIYFQLPDYLSTSTGDDRMVVSFSATDLTLDSATVNDPAGAAVGWIAEDPHNVTTAAELGDGGMDLYLGGKVIPSVDQTAGAYTADIILTVAYTGS